MTVRRIELGFSLCVFATACAPAPQDTVEPDACRTTPEASLPSVDDARLAAWAKASTHVVRGRVRLTGTAVSRSRDKSLSYDYVVVDVLDFLKGDPWSTAPRYRRSFPLLELKYRATEETPQQRVENRALLAPLHCLEDHAFVFFVSLPGPGPLQEAAVEPPAPVVRAFGPYDVPLAGVAPESDAERALALIRR